MKTETQIKNLFTPRINPHSDIRVSMSLSDEDFAGIGRGRPWATTVTDLLENRTYVVRGAACAIRGCFCDAVICEEVEI